MSFKAGDKVIDIIRGNGEVIKTDFSYTYPICVYFQNDYEPRWFTAEGRYTVNDYLPSLYHAEGFVPPSSAE